MFNNTKAYSGFSVDSITRAKEFYRGTLGLEVTEVAGMGGRMTLHLAGDLEVLVYAKADHVPATFTILFFAVEDIDAAVDQLVRNGVSMERYDGFPQDERGVVRGDRSAIAWFTDPAGNVLSVIEKD